MDIEHRPFRVIALLNDGFTKVKHGGAADLHSVFLFGLAVERWFGWWLTRIKMVDPPDIEDVTELKEVR